MGQQQQSPQPQPQPQQDRRPGLESEMTPRPGSDDPAHHGSGKLAGKVALVTDGDSSIGRAIAIAFAKEGADGVIVYLREHRDANETWKQLVALGRKCLPISGNAWQEGFCKTAEDRALDEFGHGDILVNIAAEQHRQQSVEDITEELLIRRFRTSIFACFLMVKANLSA